ncbi:MAG: LPS export ABC transporter permease LptG [Bdellovibrionales bacterium RBG_16_40_8]|nr:MAG: LPS export ABC transporter permease LptG [Bdellovibrionales bacterium RBG_16_40_8]
MIIDRYIIKNFLGFFVAGLVVFVTIFLVVEFTTTSMRFQVGADILLRYYQNYIPIIIYQLLPVGAMVGTLFTLSYLNRNNELVALFSMGISLARVSLPILALVGLISIATFWVGDRLVPIFAQKRNYIFYVEMKKKPGLFSTVKTDKIWYRSDNAIFNIQTLNAEKGLAQGITLYYFDDSWSLIQVIKAKTVTMQNRTWNLTDGTVTLLAEDTNFPLTKSFSKKTLNMSEDLADIRTAPPTSEALSFSHLRRFIQKNKEAGFDTLRSEVDMHSKISFAMAALVLSLVGIPFTVQRGRSSGSMFSIGVCIASAFFYWITYSASLSLGKNGVLPPIIAAWAPNVLMGGAALYFLLRTKK